MKQIISYLLIFITIFSLGINVLAVSNSPKFQDVFVSYDVVDNLLNISGTIENSKKGIAISLILRNDIDEAIVYSEYTIADYDTNNNLKFNFSNICLSDFLALGKYKISLYLGRLGEVDNIDEWHYSSGVYVFDVNDKIISINKIANASVLDLEEILPIECEKLSFDMSIYNTLGRSGSLAVRTAVANSELITDINILREKYQLLKNTLRLQTLIASLSLGLSDAAFDNTIDLIKKEFSKDIIVGNIYYNSASKDKFMNEQTREDLRLSLSNTDLMAVESVSLSIREKSVLKAVELSPTSQVQLILDEMDKMQLGAVDYTYFNKIKSDYNKNIVYASVALKKFSSINMLITTFEDTAKSVYISENESKSEGVGSSGRGSSVSVDIQKPYNPIPDLTPVKKETFTDLAGYEWAKMAIEGLYKNEIIAGKQAELFAPYDNITRAEFVKILVNTFKISTTQPTENVFEDVLYNEWYAPYIFIAKQKELILGDNNYFYPNKSITREDATVMLWRFIQSDKLLLLKKGDVKEFSDILQISDYAIEAVEKLQGFGLINGMGNNEFTPKGNMKRAEAAVMLFKLIEEIQ
jgi:hypothetical protein